MAFRRFPTQKTPSEQVWSGWTGGFSYRIDPTAAPKTFDLLRAHDAPNGKVAGEVAALGIYEIDGDKLTLRLAAYLPTVKSDQRPKNFAVAPDSADVLFVLERYRPPEDEKALEQGSWAIVSQTEDGKPIPRKQLRYHSPVPHQTEDGNWAMREEFHDITYGFYDDSMRATGVSFESPEGPYDLDATKQPKQITISWDHAGHAVDILGIYKLAGDRLTIAYHKGGPRPTAFQSKPGSGVTLLELKKAEPPKFPAGSFAGFGGMGGMGGAVVGAAEPPEEQSKEPPLQFGPVIERVVNALGEGKGGEGLDLAGGKLVDVPKEFTKWSAKQRDKWSTENNVDLVVDPSPDTDMYTGPAANKDCLAFASKGLKLAAIGNEKWERATDKELHAALASLEPGCEYRSDGSTIPRGDVSERHGLIYYVPYEAPTAFAFQTRKGDLGILQVIRFTAEPRA